MIYLRVFIKRKVVMCLILNPRSEPLELLFLRYLSSRKKQPRWKKEAFKSWATWLLTLPILSCKSSLLDSLVPDSTHFVSQIFFGRQPSQLVSQHQRYKKSPLEMVYITFSRGPSSYSNYPSYLRKAMVALCPPNPKELLIATLTSCFLA